MDIHSLKRQLSSAKRNYNMDEWYVHDLPFNRKSFSFLDIYSTISVHSQYLVTVIFILIHVPFQ